MGKFGQFRDFYVHHLFFQEQFLRLDRGRLLKKILNLDVKGCLKLRNFSVWLLLSYFQLQGGG